MPPNDVEASRARYLPRRSHRSGPADRPSAQVLLSGADTEGRFALVETLDLRGEEPPYHLHHWEDETLYVLEGTLTVYLAGRAMPAPPGTIILLPRGEEHTFVVQSEQARVVRIFTPAGFEGFYRDMDTPGGATSHRSDASCVERLVAVAARYGCEITGPAPHGAPHRKG